MEWQPIYTILLSVGLSGIISWLVAGRRLKWEFGLEIATVRAVKELLNHPNWKKRSFGEMRKRIGGFEENELRRFLVAAGAVRFQKSGDSSVLDSDDEMWGLLDENKKEL